MLRLKSSHETVTITCESHKRKDDATISDATTEDAGSGSGMSAGTAAVDLEQAPLPPRFCTEATAALGHVLNFWRSRRHSAQPLCERERGMLVRVFYDTMPSDRVKLVQIKRVQPGTLRAFCNEEQISLNLEREKKKTHKEFMMLHGTGWGNIESIKAEGLDPDLGRSSKGSWLGYNAEACHAYAAKGPGPAQANGCRLFAMFAVACVPNIHEGDEERSFGVWRIVSRLRMCPAYLLIYAAPLEIRARRRRAESPRSSRSSSPFRRTLASPQTLSPCEGWSHSRDIDATGTNGFDSSNFLAWQRSHDELLPGRRRVEMRPSVFPNRITSSKSQSSLPRCSSLENVGLVRDSCDIESTKPNIFDSSNLLAPQRCRDEGLPGRPCEDMRPSVFSNSMTCSKSQSSLPRGSSVDNGGLIRDDRRAGEVQILSARGIVRYMRSCSPQANSSLRCDPGKRYMKSTRASRGKSSTSNATTSRPMQSENRWAWTSLGVDDMSPQGTHFDNERLSFCTGLAQQASSPQSLPEDTRDSFHLGVAQKASGVQSRSEQGVGAVRDKCIDLHAPATCEMVLLQQSISASTKPAVPTPRTSNVSRSRCELTVCEQRDLRQAMQQAHELSCAWAPQLQQKVWPEEGSLALKWSLRIEEAWRAQSPSHVLYEQSIA